MGKKIKEYWSFEENSKLKPYQLGQVINIQEESANLKRSTDDDFDYEYIGWEKFLWIVTIKNSIIVRIVYKNNFSIPNFDFWNNNYNLIHSSLIKTCRLVDESYLKDRMCVITRDDFVSLIILQKGKD
ncbi:hypothetical protein [Flavobacterium praedii]|uniref:hypothetical protein n=1 Tax=Flavobacterium praedii TaxID=3002900 RepID=UPI002481A58A|nr:hypothetical protein [Flavobacterium praedii]